MNQQNSILTPLSDYSPTSFAPELKHIKTLRLQALGLGIISVGLLYLCYCLYFTNPTEYPAILKLLSFSKESSPNHGLIIALLIAAIGNIFASQLILNEARREARVIKKLMNAYKENVTQGH